MQKFNTPIRMLAIGFYRTVLKFWNANDEFLRIGHIRDNYVSLSVEQFYFLSSAKQDGGWELLMPESMARRVPSASVRGGEKLAAAVDSRQRAASGQQCHDKDKNRMFGQTFH